VGIFIILSTIILFLLVHSSTLLGSLSAEAALLFTAFLAPLSFMAGVFRGAKHNAKGFLTDFVKEGIYLLIAFLIFIIAAFFNSFRFESCASDKGLFPFLILSTPVLLLNLIIGIWVGRIIKKPKLALIVSVFLIFIYFIFQGIWWWNFPSLRFFNHNFTIIVGDLLTGQSLNPAIVAYRFSTFLYALTFFMFGLSYFKSGIFVIIFAVLIQIESSHLISPDRAFLENQYSLIKKSGFLILHADPTQITSNQAEAMLAEGNLWLERLYARSQIAPNANIHIWLHANMEIQEQHTGAKNVHFTLPSHREIHISNVIIPHPTLGHELAHVLLGQISTTFFGVIGAHYVFPNNGLNEGLAVFLTPELMIMDDLSLMEQAAAIYRLGYLQDFEALFSIKPWKFWSESSQRAYVMAGAFLEFLFQNQTSNPTEEKKLIQTLAASGKILPDFNQHDEWELLKINFLNKLKSISLPNDALPSVRRRFFSPSIAFAQCGSKAPQNNDFNDTRRKGEILENESDVLWKTNELAKAMQIYHEIDWSSFSLPSQRQLAIKKALLESAYQNHNASLMALTILELLSSSNLDEAKANALQAQIAFLLGQPPAYYSLTFLAQFYSEYLYARAQILGRNYESGLVKLLKLTSNNVAPELFKLEVNRLLAIAYAAKEEPALAFEIYNQLLNESMRPAHQLFFSDMKERAIKVENALHHNASPLLKNDKWLLGIFKD